MHNLCRNTHFDKYKTPMETMRFVDFFLLWNNGNYACVQLSRGEGRRRKGSSRKTLRLFVVSNIFREITYFIACMNKSIIFLCI